MRANDSFFKDLSNKPSPRALVQKLGELHFQQAYLVIFSTACAGFSQNLAMGSKEFTTRKLHFPLIFLRKLSIFLLKPILLS